MTTDQGGADVAVSTGALRNFVSAIAVPLVILIVQTVITRVLPC